MDRFNISCQVHSQPLPTLRHLTIAILPHDGIWTPHPTFHHPKLCHPHSWNQTQKSNCHLKWSPSCLWAGSTSYGSPHWQRFMPFKKGEKVWLEARNLKCLVTNPKFAPKREGPFTITKVLSPITYQLHLPKTWKFTWSSMPPSYLPITKTMYTVWTFPTPHLTLSQEKRNTR